MKEKKLIANAVGAFIGRPHFGENTLESPTAYSNSKSKIKTLTSDHKAITLIALVITIIVMLILVAVTVTVAIKGGLFTTAKQATTDTQYHADREMLLSAVIGAINNDAEVDFTKLDANLPQGFKGTQGEYTSEAGNTFYVDKNGNITDEKVVTPGSAGVQITVEQVAQNPEKYYGKRVTNYQAYDGDTNVYRIFFVDSENYFGDGKNTIYLKADPIKNESSPWLEENFSDETKMAQLNPAWKKEKEKKPDVTYSSVKFSSWLSDPDVELWSRFADKQNPLVNYAVGGPSIEMYMKSYDESHASLINEKKIGRLDFKISSSLSYVFLLDEKEAYLLPDSDTNQTISIDSSNFGGMYGSGPNEKWCMCSPVYQDDDEAYEPYLATVRGSELFNLWISRAVPVAKYGS